MKGGRGSYQDVTVIVLVTEVRVMKWADNRVVN